MNPRKIDQRQQNKKSLLDFFIKPRMISPHHQARLPPHKKGTLNDSFQLSLRFYAGRL